MDEYNVKNAHKQPKSHWHIRSRISNACDNCKARKTKCDGNLPCGCCIVRRPPEGCRYSPHRRRKKKADRLVSAKVEGSLGGRTPGDTTADGKGSSSDMASVVNGEKPVEDAIESSAEDDTDVPLEARLLCDDQGKLIFIGDCAPWSFFQSVRQLMTCCLGQRSFAPETSHLALENMPAGHVAAARGIGRCRNPPPTNDIDIEAAIANYLVATTSLVDLFDISKLLEDLHPWATMEHKSDELASINNYLVLAIGTLQKQPALSQEYFEYAQSEAYTTLGGSLSMETVQIFLLITVYLLCSCRVHSAFLFIGIASRAALSIGIHRTQVNAQFGPDIHRQRDRLWKSIRAVDLFLSISIGRPTSASDVDCTVPYRVLDVEGNDVLDLLNASVQILIITGDIVLKLYSKGKISLQLTEGISRQLRDWSERWLPQLKDVITQVDTDGEVEMTEAEITGACQVLSSYYYAVMLVSRPFLLYKLLQRLHSSPSVASTPSTTPCGKSKLADACTEAASLMAELILDLIGRGILNGRAPLIVLVLQLKVARRIQSNEWVYRSWLFASSLILGVSLLGGYDRVVEKYCRMTVVALGHFANNGDDHAAQYSLIAQSLLTTAMEYLERREFQEQLRKTENAARIFGLVPSGQRKASVDSILGIDESRRSSTTSEFSSGRGVMDQTLLQHQCLQEVPHPRLVEIDMAFIGSTESLTQTPDNEYWSGNIGGAPDARSVLNLFPVFNLEGGIDLSQHF